MDQRPQSEDIALGEPASLHEALSRADASLAAAAEDAGGRVAAPEPPPPAKPVPAASEQPKRVKAPTKAKRTVTEKVAAALKALPSEQTAPVTQPAIPADDAFANMIMAARDAAVVEEQAYRAQKLAVLGQYERELERLNAWRDGNVRVLDAQIAQRGSIISASDRALDDMNGGNVVPMRRDGDAA